MVPSNVLHSCCLGIGSNLNNPCNQLIQAIYQLKSQTNINVIKVSKFYKSKPLGEPSQPDFFNCAIQITTPLSPTSLLKNLMAIESLQNKKKYMHWGPRTIDIDILLYDGNKQYNDPNLQIPHPHILSRDFVLQPLQDLNPELILPNG